MGEESEEIPSFSKERFFKNIEENLSIIGTYYQGVLLNDLNPKGDSKTKTKFKKILDKLDSRMIFYRFYLQPTILKLREKGYEKKRIDFTPTYLDDEYGTPLYFLVIAKKI